MIYLIGMGPYIQIFCKNKRISQYQALADVERIYGLRLIKSDNSSCHLLVFGNNNFAIVCVDLVKCQIEKIILNRQLPHWIKDALIFRENTGIWKLV